jgi:peptide/nickel transport system substrate-binding protein
MEAVEGQWTEMGADCEIVIVDGAVQKSVVFEGEFDLMFSTAGVPDPGGLRSKYHSTEVHELGMNWTHYQDDEMDALLEEGNSITDFEERKRVYNEVQKKIVEEALTVPVRNTGYIFAVAREVQGWVTADQGWPYVYDMRLGE